MAQLPPRSKLVAERIRIEFNFLSKLGLGETITSWRVEVSVQSGLDPSPNNLIAPRRFLEGPIAFQWIKDGLPGVIYRLVAIATGSTGRVYKLERVLAVLPSLQAFPPLFGTLFTSTLYPINHIDNIVSSGVPLKTWLLTPPVGFLTSTGIPLSGVLATPFVSILIRPLAFNSFGVPISGNLATPLVSYSIRPEALNSSGIPISGTLATILISYSIRPEALNSSGIPISGTLT
ncbi:MAG: hypothetical protein DDT42_01846 [candidate division WS2 bacterium]|uniref:Uncharacterized protein n=1 Tax=Psychracetigena formicireducens TaxID=2986056 RepID=A0A9E2BI50_PSYF1|nr:hypothetical protein [Candidatus Psychracetigena formicireducens]